MFLFSLVTDSPSSLKKERKKKRIACVGVVRFHFVSLSISLSLSLSLSHWFRHVSFTRYSNTSRSAILNRSFRLDLNLFSSFPSFPRRRAEFNHVSRQRKTPRYKNEQTNKTSNKKEKEQDKRKKKPTPPHCTRDLLVCRSFSFFTSVLFFVFSKNVQARHPIFGRNKKNKQKKVPPSEGPDENRLRNNPPSHKRITPFLTELTSLINIMYSQFEQNFTSQLQTPKKIIKMKRGDRPDPIRTTLTNKQTNKQTVSIASLTIVSPLSSCLSSSFPWPSP